MTAPARPHTGILRGRRLEVWLYLVQRLTALIMAPLVITHLVVIVIAVRGGLSAEEILARTRASMVWPAFYGVFVVAAALHGAIGLRVLCREHVTASLPAANALALAYCAGVLVLGYLAVAAVS